MTRQNMAVWKTRIVSAIVGAVATLAVGFLGLGWKGPDAIAQRVAAGTDAGRTEVLASSCADRFMAQAPAVEAMKAATYGRDSVVNKFVKATDGNELSYGVAGACASAVVKRIEESKKS